MRKAWLLGLVVSGCTETPSVPPSEALYRRMEDRLLLANTIQFTARIRFHGEVKGDRNGVVRIDRDSNRVQYHMKGIFYERSYERKILSDGERVTSYERDGASESQKNAEGAIGEFAILAFARQGLYAGLERRGWGRKDIPTPQKIGDGQFRLMGKETINEKGCDIIEVVWQRVPDSPSGEDRFRLWIDRVSHLPVKLQREMWGEVIAEITEDYSDFQINEPIKD